MVTDKMTGKNTCLFLCDLAVSLTARAPSRISVHRCLAALRSTMNRNPLDGACLAPKAGELREVLREVLREAFLLLLTRQADDAQLKMKSL
jgi:hypothetical protein